ncbi:MULTISPECIES: SRPBCC family protein [Amycolatopsis]|uniref:SRPBCC domain-containing protein n=1 Tax=Amycolatopsis dongchuanensis TaxID=1070866 RepID=A0ABP9QPE9_9PSEU
MSGWPEGMAPDQATLHARNELTIPAAPEPLWDRLVDATAWPAWYPNARNVRVLGATELAEGVRFRWTTFGLRGTCTVTTFRPYRELAWSSAFLGSRAHHRWRFTAKPDGTTTVVTEETQRGLLPGLFTSRVRAGLLHWHQRWLEGLA